jgi:hypothetical protein
MVGGNSPHRGSRFALIRKDADFRVVWLSQVHVRDSLGGKLVRDRWHYGSAPLVPAMRRIDEVMLAKVSRAVARPASVRRLTLCASCMQGNLHVQFFGGPGSGRIWGYPLKCNLTSPQHGQRGSLLAISRAMSTRSVEIESGTCRWTRPAAARDVTFG